MFHSSRWVTQEGLGLSMCRKILKLMNGEVRYIRESERCYFLVILEVPMPQKVGKGAADYDAWPATSTKELSQLQTNTCSAAP